MVITVRHANVQRAPAHDRIQQVTRVAPSADVRPSKKIGQHRRQSSDRQDGPSSLSVSAASSSYIHVPARTACMTVELGGERVCVVPQSPAAPTPPPTSAASSAPAPAAPSAPPAPTYTADEAAAQAWSTQPFAHPEVNIQPVGNVTLPGLPTYFEAGFPTAGLEPGEEVTVTLLGHTLTMRPRNVQYTYHFGDGSTLGPTSNAGGPYPTGTIRHAYTKTGSVNVRIDMTLGGEFKEGAGAWQAIPGTTTVAGPTTRLDVRPLQSRLHDNG